MTKNILLALNKLFKLPQHPLNMQAEDKKTYAEWQYQNGERTLQFFEKYATIDEMFKDKVVLDMGCGASGKTLYYAKQGVKKIYGVDVVRSYKKQSEELANKLGYKELFEFVLANADSLPLSDKSVDTIIMNDAMEHFSDPEAVLLECKRVLTDAGKIYINFPPYHHPYGAHLSDRIGIPWVELFFSDRVMIEAYKHLCKDVPDGKDRVSFRISKDVNGKEYFSYINKMTIRRAAKILKKSNYKVVYYKEEPLRNILSVAARIPIIKELFVKMVVVVLEK